MRALGKTPQTRVNTFTRKIIRFALAAVMTGSCVLPVSAAGDKKFIDFIVKNAHDQGFKTCDAAIRQAFDLASGTDVRVLTSPIPGVNSANSLKMNVVYGKIGDTVQQDAVFRNLGSSCSYSLTITISSQSSCVAVLSKMNKFKYVAETNGVIYTRNSGGVNLLLTPIGQQSCIQTYITDRIVNN